MWKSQENQRKTSKTNTHCQDNSILQLIYQAHYKSYPKQLIDSLLLIAYLIYLTIICINNNLLAITNQKILIPTLEIAIGMLVILAIIFLQIAIGIIYKYQFYLSLQFKVFRYLLFAPIVRFLSNQYCLREGSIAFIFGIIILLAIVWGLGLILAQQNFIQITIIPTSFPINSFFLFFETAFIASEFTQNSLTRKSILAILFVYGLLIKYSIIKQSPVYSFQEKVVKLINNLMIFFSTLLFFIDIIAKENAKESLYPLIPIQIMIILISLISLKKVPSKVVQVFQNQSLTSQEFILRIQYVIEEIRNSNQAQVPQFVDSIIGAFCEENQKQNNLSCPLLIETKKGLLKGLGQQKTMKQGLMKISKKIQSLFQQVCVNDPQNQRLKIAMLKFYAICIKNRTKMSQLLAQINYLDLSIFLWIDLYSINRQMESIQNFQTVQSLSVDEAVTQFNIKLLALLNCISQFWTQLLQQSVDLNKLMVISEKIFPNKRMVQKQCDIIADAGNYTSVLILKTFAQYTRIILNDEKNANIIQDYMTSLNKKLLEMRQIKTLSADSQTATIALSLSEGSLGNIKMVNSQAAFIFGYVKSQIIKLRVNQIMPKTFSKHHDDILLTFLGNRNKMINTDQRQVLGKSKSGFIFPIILQLQSTITSVSQQLIFVANVKKTKTRQGPIYCVVNQQGIVEDYSSMFKALFLKAKTKQNVNVQQIIPQFFSQDCKSGQIESFHLSSKVQGHFGGFEISFKVNQINLPCHRNAGYVLKGSFKKENYKTRLSFTDKLLEKKQQGLLKANNIRYQYYKNEYFIENKRRILSEFGKGQQFTIPFLMISDMASILSINDNSKRFDTDIKSVRWNKDHLQRIQQAQSFYSQDYSQFDAKIGLKKKLSELKDGAMMDHKDNFSRRVKIIITILSFILAGYLAFLMIQYSEESQKSINHSYIQQNKLLSRNLITQLVVYFTSIDSNIDAKRLIPKKKALQNQLIKVLNQALITQQQKQQALKILYLQKKSNLQAVLTNQNLFFNIQPQLNQIDLKVLWILFFIGILFLLAILIVSLCILIRKIQETYSIFLTMDQKTIRDSLNSCIIFSKKIQREINRTQQFQKKQRYDEQLQDSPVQKFKKFKNTQNQKIKLYFFKLIVPFIIYLILSTATIIIVTQQFGHLNTDRKLHYFSSLLNAESSVATMKSVLKQVQGIEINLNLKFIRTYQSIQKQIQTIYKDKANGKLEFYQYMLDNPCSLQNMPSNCETFLDGIMEGGLSKAVNYLSTSLQALDQGQIIGNKTFISQLIYLQYEIIKPILSFFSNKILVDIVNDQEKQKLMINGLHIGLIVLILVGCFYLCKYPVENFKNQVNSTSQLVKLIPNNQRKPQSNGYVNLDW